MAPIWSKQPFKAVFITFQVFKTLILVPWLLVRYSLKSARPFPEWSLKLSVTNPIIRQLFTFYAATRTNAMSIVASDHEKAKDRYSLVQPADSKVYTGIVTPGAAQPAAVGGLWYPAPPPPPGEGGVGDEKVVLHLPGGAFVLAFGQEMYGRDVSTAISQYLGVTRTFFAQYRPATDDATRFPAAIQDAVTFYSYILSLGYKPQNITLSGDSAAGNLVIALLRHLEEEEGEASNLPLPAGAMVWSPWVHVTPQAGADYEACPNADSDCLVAPLLQWGVEAYFPKHEPTAEELAYISPLHHPFRTRVPLFIQGGTTEALFDTIEEFAKEMADVDGNRVKFQPTDFAPHALIMSYNGLGLEEKIESALKEASKFFGY